MWELRRDLRFGGLLPVLGRASSGDRVMDFRPCFSNIRKRQEQTAHSLGERRDWGPHRTSLFNAQIPGDQVTTVPR